MRFEVHSLEEFRQAFNSEKACLEYLLKCRWPYGFICPHCGNDKYCEIKTPFGYECSSCCLRTSPTAGTAMHRSHVSLQNWFLAIYLASQPKGISAGKLSDEMNCSYRTALRMLRLARNAMSAVPQPILSGDVDAGQCMLQYGGVSSSNSLSVFVFCAVEWPILSQRPFKFQRIFLAAVCESSKESIISFLHKNVAEGSKLLTQDWRSHPKAILKCYRPASDPTSSTFSSLALNGLQQWLGSVYRRVEPKYLQSYLDEFSFHYNRQFSPETAFHDLLSAFCESIGRMR
jgi:hypothetical protein